jgi:hypothetical protein
MMFSFGEYRKLEDHMEEIKKTNIYVQGCKGLLERITKENAHSG